MFWYSADGDALAGDAQPEAALWEVEGDAEAENKNNSSGPDKEGATVFGNEQHRRFGGIIEGDGPLFIKALGRLPNVEAAHGFVAGGRRTRRADADNKERIRDLRKLEVRRMREDDGQREAGSGNRNAAREVYLQALFGSGLVKHDRLVANEAATGVANGECDRGNERRLVEDDPIIRKRIVDAQVVAVRHKLAVAVNAQVGHVVGRQAGRAVEGRCKVVDAETDVVRSAARVDNGALTGRQGLIECEPGEAIAEADERSRKDAPGGAIQREAMPLRKDARHQQGDEGCMKDEGGKGSPGVSVGIQVGDRFIVAAGHRANAIVTPA